MFLRVSGCLILGERKTTQYAAGSDMVDKLDLSVFQ